MSPFDQPSLLERISVVTGDITRLPPALAVDTIVNAANKHLLGGGGVDGAIHQAAGPRLLEHNRTLGGCDTGMAKSAPGFDLERVGIRHIILTVGPIWLTADDAEDVPLGAREEDRLLASCYDESLALAAVLGSDVLAFPAISTGVYGFPKARATTIALDRVLEWLQDNERPSHVVFCCFAERDAELYRAAIAAP